EQFPRMARAEAPPTMSIPDVIGLADVGTTLVGPAGAISIFGRQKGLSQREVGQLDAELSALVRRLRIQNDREHWTVPGSGAAGGLGYGILAFLHGRLVQ